jgi:hypothetical protein
LFDQHSADIAQCGLGATLEQFRSLCLKSNVRAFICWGTNWKMAFLHWRRRYSRAAPVKQSDRLR